jgi:T-complex protein 1 subunit theta
VFDCLVACLVGLFIILLHCHFTIIHYTFIVPYVHSIIYYHLKLIIIHIQFLLFFRLGMNKLIVNNLNKLFVTNDAGTILREVEVEHPAARLILLASQQQDREVGDATNLVIVLISELLLQAEKLLRMGLKASIVVDGFELAFARAQEIMSDESETLLASEHISKDLKPLLRSVISSKQRGLEDRLAVLVNEAIAIALPAASPRSFNVDNVRCVKIMGASLSASHVLQGMVFNREASSQIKNISAGADALKVAVFTCPISSGRTETKGTVLLHDAKEMLDFNRGEEAILSRQISEIAATGVKVIVSGDQISDLAVHFIDRAGIMAVRIPSKFDLRRLCRAIGATPLARLGAPLAEEMGSALSVESLEIGSDRCTVFKSASGCLATIVLRGSTQNSLDDLERCIEDAVNTVRTIHTHDDRIVPGAGACEMALSRGLSKFADLTPGVSQYAVRAFAEAFQIVPRILAMNAGFDSYVSLARLSAAQESLGPGQGLNIDDPESILDSKAAGVVDSLAAKKSAVHLAVDAALTILRVDQIIMAKPAGGPKPRAPGSQDSDD